MQQNIDYKNTSSTPEEHIALLKERGLLIGDTEKAIFYLTNIGYFRLAGYMFHMQDGSGSHNFEEGKSFDDVIKHYQFDKKLRLLFFNYLERIEVALRARLSDTFSLEHGFFWYTIDWLYADKAVFGQTTKVVKQSFDDEHELFLKRFKNNYPQECMPPSNMAMETLSLGKLSRLYSGLANGNEKQAVSEGFGLPRNILESWFSYISIIRNICAHHSRLWNRHFSVNKPIIPSRKKNQFKGTIPENFNCSLYGATAIIARLLQNINPQNNFVTKLTQLLDEYPQIDECKHMGFPHDWRENPAWE